MRCCSLSHRDAQRVLAILCCVPIMFGIQGSLLVQTFHGCSQHKPTSIVILQVESRYPSKTKSSPPGYGETPIISTVNQVPKIFGEPGSRRETIRRANIG